MTNGLLKNSINFSYVEYNFIKNNQLDIEFLFVKDFDFFVEVVPELFDVRWFVLFG